MVTTSMLWVFVGSALIAVSEGTLHESVRRKGSERVAKVKEAEKAAEEQEAECTEDTEDAEDTPMRGYGGKGDLGKEKEKDVKKVSVEHP